MNKYSSRQMVFLVGRTLRVSRSYIGRLGPPATLGVALRAGRDASPYLVKSLSAYLILFSAVLFLTAGCGTPPAARRVDPELDRSAAAAKNAYASGAISNATMFYEKALTRARMTDQGADIARLAYNLAACRAQEQNYPEALKLLDEARFESERAGLDLPEIKLLRAEILRRQGKTAEAIALAEAGIETAGSRKDAPSVIQFRLFLAELACDRKDAAQALAELDKIDRKALDQAPLVTRAGTAAARGRALLMKKQLPEAAAYFDNAAEFYRRSQRYVEMAAALDNAGNAYEAGMNRQAALDRYYRAARSLKACGEKAKGREALKKAGALAAELQDKEMLAALARLQGE